MLGAKRNARAYLDLIAVESPYIRRGFWRNKNGWLLFNITRSHFIINEGGRGLTLTIAKWCPFRLYIAGWVLQYRGVGAMTPGWSFRKAGQLTI